VNTIYLCLERRRSEKRLLIFSSPELDKHCASSVEPYRISPLFPVARTHFFIPKNEDNYVVSFFVFDRPFSAIASLVKTLDEKKQGHLWFSHGLCSLIVFAKDINLVKQIIEQTADCGLRAYEVWKVEKAKIKQTKPFFSKPSAFEQSDFSIDESGFDADICAVICELKHCLTTAVRLSAQFIPRDLELYKRLATATRDIIAELRFLYNLHSQPPKSFSGATLTAIRSDAIKRQKMKHQRVGHLVQINSSLAYVISQAFSGTIPLFESDCQTRTFSFLGIGSAYRALSAFSRFIEAIFQDYPVDDVISQEFHKLPGLGVQIFPDDHHEEVKKWTDARWSVDTEITRVTKSYKKANLVYFSGRLGFRESEFAITAALQVLTSACTAPWSLMTFTHEMMHSHVRGLLAAIFSDRSDEPGSEPLGAIIERYYIYVDSQPEGPLPHSFLDSLCFLVLAYFANHWRLQPVLEEQLKTGKFRIRNARDYPDTRELAVEFTKYNREIHEIFVHVLDFNYFYNAKAQTYLGLLWQSWLPVPVVLDDVQNYVWRSLLALASQHSGQPESRFKAVCDAFTSTLRDFNQKAAVPSPLIQSALSLLENERSRNAVYFRFINALPIVDMVQKFLCSSHIHAELYEDENAEEVSNEYHYSLQTAEFKKIQLVSPIAFTADRLRRALAKEPTSVEDMHAAAWFFLACSECLRQKGKP
jgi:hypothetical protein